MLRGRYLLPPRAVAFDRWAQILADEFARFGYVKDEAAGHAQMLICAVEGALILTRVVQTRQPLENVAARLISLLAKP